MLGEGNSTLQYFFTSLIVNFSRKMNMYMKRILEPKLFCACYFTVSCLNCWHKNGRTSDIFEKWLGFLLTFIVKCQVSLNIRERWVLYLLFPSPRSPFIQTDLLSFQRMWDQGLEAGLQSQPFDFLWHGQRTTSARTSFTVNQPTPNDWCRADPPLLQSDYSCCKVTIFAFKQPRLEARLCATWKRTGHGNFAYFS